MSGRTVWFISISFLLVTTILASRNTSFQFMNNRQNSASQVYRVHNLNTSLSYETIQEALDASETLDGHAIFVDAGVYLENVTVNKMVKLLGENKEAIVDGDGADAVIKVTSENVTIGNFTVQNSGRTLGIRSGGVLLDGSNGSLVANNNIVANKNGIYVSGSHNAITGNTIFNNTSYGIEVYSGFHNIIDDNTVFDNPWNGIMLTGATQSNVLENNVVTNNGWGISVNANNTVVGNNVSNNEHGIWLGAGGNTLRNNIMKNNTLNLQVIPPGSWETVYSLDFFINDIENSNKVNGKPVYYWTNQHDSQAPLDAGYLALINCKNIVASNLTLANNEPGLLLANSTGCLLESLRVIDNDNAIVLWGSSNNKILNNNVTTSSAVGISLYCTNEEFPVENNTIYHNNFVFNFRQAFISAVPGSTNGTEFHEDYPAGGNYWSDYNGTDVYDGQYQNETGSDGICDGTYLFLAMIKGPREYPADYPLIAPINIFDAGTWNGDECYVHVCSNSTVSDFGINNAESRINFNVSGETGLGFCRLTIPNVIVEDFWLSNYTVLVDGVPPLETRSWKDIENTYVYFTYQHSEHEVTIVPEHSQFIFLPLFMAVTLVAVIVYKRKTKISEVT